MSAPEERHRAQIADGSIVSALLEQVPPRSHRIVLAPEHALYDTNERSPVRLLFLDADWSGPVVPPVSYESAVARFTDRIGTGDTLWVVVTEPTRGRGRLACRLRFVHLADDEPGRRGIDFDDRVIVDNADDVTLFASDVDSTDILRQLSFARGATSADEFEALLQSDHALTSADVALLGSHAATLLAAAAAAEAAAGANGELTEIAEFLSVIVIEFQAGFVGLPADDRVRVERAMRSEVGGDAFEEVKGWDGGGIASAVAQVVRPEWKRVAEDHALPVPRLTFGRVVAELLRRAAARSDLDDWLVEPPPDDESTNARGQLVSFADDIERELDDTDGARWLADPPTVELRDRLDEWSSILSGEPSVQAATELLGSVTQPLWREWAQNQPAADLVTQLSSRLDVVVVALAAAARMAGAHSYRTTQRLGSGTWDWLQRCFPGRFEREGRSEVLEFAVLEGRFDHITDAFATAVPMLLDQLTVAISEADDNSMRYGRVVAVSGHMVDAPDRETPRFPPAAVARVTADLERVLDELDIGPDDLLICGGARGADLIAAEAAQRRGAKIELLLAKPEREFIDSSVRLPGDDGWEERYRAVSAEATVLVQDEVLGPLGEENRYERNNSWLVSRSSSIAEGAPVAVVVWDGSDEGDGEGGTASFVQLARRRDIDVRIIELPGPAPSRTFSIEMLPAGNGTSLLIEYGAEGSTHRVVIDCGTKGTPVSKRVRSDTQSLELLVLTHIDANAIGGAFSLLEDPDLTIGDVWFNGHQHTTGGEVL